VAMYVHRTSASGLDIHQKDYWSTLPCNLAYSQGVYLTRETTGTQTSCEFWQLVDTCPAGTKQCVADPSMACTTHTTNDPNNCGGCGNVCGTANASAYCGASRCELSCNSGFADCNQVNSDGCEIDVDTNLNDCGACGNICGSAGTSAVACNQGSCALTCAAGYQNCDGKPGNGCEVQSSVDPLDCGTCGNDCLGAICQGGQCQGSGAVVASVPGVVGLAVDDTSLYYEVSQYNTYGIQTTTLSAIDKINGGTPTVIVPPAVSSFDGYSVAGDGSVYLITNAGPPGWIETLSRWTGATATTLPLVTLPAGATFLELQSDAHGAAWESSQTVDGGSVTQFYAWSPGSSAPTLLSSVPGSFYAVAMNSTYVFYWDSGGTSATLMGVPRAGGAPVALASAPSGDVSTSKTTAADDSYVYIFPSSSTAIDRLPLGSTGGADGGAPAGSFSAWATPSNQGNLLENATAVFVTPASQVVEVPKVDSPVATPVATASFTSSGEPVAIDATAVYLYDYAVGQIRRVPL
jgi:hypothetical protein